MTSRSRYGLIVGGILIFAIGAPTLVLFVQGKKLSLEHKRTEITGIIAAVTKPSGATIAVNGSVQKETPGAVRFLKTGDYTVTLSKDGYRTWQKTLSVVAAKVTHVNPNPNELILLKDTPPNELTSRATNFTLAGKTVAYATEDPPTIVLLNEQQDTQSVPLPGPATTLQADNDNTGILIIGRTFTLVLDIATRKTINVTKVLDNGAKPTLASGRVWTISPAGDLKTFIPGQKPAPTKLRSNVLSFLVEGKDIYYLQKNQHDTQLHHAEINNGTVLQDQVLTSGISTATRYTLFTDTAKAVYLLGDSTVWRLNDSPALISHNVTAVNTLGGSLAYSTPGELWWYDSSANKSRLVSRATSPFSAFYIDPNLQYALFVQDKNLVALELDGRSGQNQYVLDSGSELGTTLALRDGTTVLYQNGDTLKTLVLF